MTTSASPLPPSGPPTLSLDTLLIAARLAFDDYSLELDDVECMCASLMEQVSLPFPTFLDIPLLTSLQGYIKAYILHSKRLLVLQKGPTVGFPPLASVNP